MNKLQLICVLILFIPLQIIGQLVSEKEALLAAQKWLEYIIETNGHWEGATDAEINSVEELRHGDKKLGYYFNVNHDGFIVVSLRRELAPIKAYSTRGNFNQECQEGVIGYIQTAVEKQLNAIKNLVGPIESAAASRVEKVLEFSSYGVWDDLINDRLANYREGRVLLSSDWSQGFPYNIYCPTTTIGCSGSRCPVGCVATAAAQIMRYYNWPPYGSGSPYNDTYDWINMPDTLVSNSAPEKIHAIAELGSEIGIAVGMDYCSDDECKSSVSTSDMEGVYENQYRYAGMCQKISRDDYSAGDWFTYLKTQFNNNWPVQYKIPGHSVVVDGWQEIGNPIIKQYHVNYGHGTDAICDNHPKTFWYTLDAICGGDPNEEYALINITPNVHLNQLDQTYSRNSSFPYRYFDMDAFSLYNVIFESGQNLQFLPGVKLTCSNLQGDFVRFDGSQNLNTHLYTSGDVSKGIRIYNGSVKLMNGGKIIIKPIGAPRYLRATVVTPAQINITWEKGHGQQDLFEIERRTLSTTFHYLTTTGSNFYADPGVTQYRSYWYRVRAISYKGERSDFSTEIRVYADNT